MGEHANAVRLRKGYEAFAAGDLDTVREMFADDIVWHVGGQTALSGDYKGTEEVIGFFGKVFEMTAGTFKLDVRDVLADDEHVVALTHATAVREGKTLDGDSVHVWNMRDGKASEFWGFDWDQLAGEEFFGLKAGP